MKIKIKTARILAGACTIILDGTHDVAAQLENGKASVAKVPFELDDRARWNLQKNLLLAQRIVETADKAKSGIARELAGGLGKTLSQADNPEKWTAYLERAERIEEGEESAPFLKVKVSGLKISNANPIPGSAVLGLRPVLDEDVPSANKEDIIPDEAVA